MTITSPTRTPPPRLVPPALERTRPARHAAHPLSPAPAAVRSPALSVSVVIPAINEAANLPYVLSRIPSWVDEVVLVDGNSTDETVAVARRFWPGVVVVGQHGRGKGDALAAGFAATTGDIIVMLDADGSTDPEEIPRYVGALLSGADFAKGSRFIQGGGSADITPFRRLGNSVLSRIVNGLWDVQFSDLCYGYNAFHRRCLAHLSLDCDGFEVETLMNVRAAGAGLSITEVPSYELRRIHGTSNLRTVRDGWRVLRTIGRECVRQRPWTRRAAPRPDTLVVDLARLEAAVAGAEAVV